MIPAGLHEKFPCMPNAEQIQVQIECLAFDCLGLYKDGSEMSASDLKVP